MSTIKRFFAAFGGRRTKIDEQRKLVRESRDGYKYCDGQRCLHLQIDMLSGKPDRLLYSSTIRQWLPPYEKEEILDAERRQIAETIKTFIERHGHTVTIQ